MISILTIVLILSLAATVWLGVFTLIRCESKKKTSFIGLQAGVFLYVLGYLLEINAQTPDGGMIAVRIMYFGSAFAPAAYLLFTADYCEIKISRFIMPFLLIVPLIIVGLVWTTPKFHDLIYTSYWYTTDTVVHGLRFTTGPMYYLAHVFSVCCCAGLIGMVVNRLKKWDKKFRPNLILILMSAVIPIFINVLYAMGFQPLGIYWTPVAMVILNILFYLAIVRYDSFGIISRATEMALQSIKEAYILFDADTNLITANKPAQKLFPTLETLEKGSSITQIQDWPTELSFHENKEIVSPAKFEMPGDNYFTASISSILADDRRLLGHIVLIQDVTEATMLTKNVQDALKEVLALKVQQDGDYFLTSLLINPLLIKEVQSKALSVDFHVSQKKKFTFKKRDAELGGDICIAREIVLGGKPYLAFTNGDAMGKSIQGAGGALVMAAIFNSYINRTPLFASLYLKSPEAWITEIYEELQRVFVSFDGSMLVSAVIGLIDEETGAMYYLNAEHPWVACYRGNEAYFVENELTMHKIGAMGFDTGIDIRAIQMQHKDVIFLGSDGRDDILVGMNDETGQRVINEDETRFLQCIQTAEGDLDKLVENITRDGELTDDFTIIRIEWKTPPPAPPPDFEAVSLSAQKALHDKDIPRAIQLLRKAMQLYPDPETIEKLAACHRERGETQEIIQVYQYGLKRMPLHETLLHGILKESRRMIRELSGGGKGKENTKVVSEYMQIALDYGERLLIVNPQHYTGLLHVADCYRTVGRLADAKELLLRARQFGPDDENLKAIERMLEREETQRAEKK